MKQVSIFAVFALALSMSACNAQQAAQNVSNAIGGILNIAQAEEQALPPADSAVVTPWVNLGVTLHSQMDTCIAASGGTKAKLAGCINTFVGGLLSPQELAALRVINPNSQHTVEVVATAIMIAANGALTSWGSTAQPMPTVGTPATQNELNDMRTELASAGYVAH